MRTLLPGVSAIVFLVITSPSVRSQTELWRSDGSLRQVRPDGRGNTFFLRGAPDNWYGPDTLFKVDAAGALLWSRPLDAPRSNIYLNGDGLYVVSEHPSDSIFRLDADGGLLWAYAHPDTHVSITEHYDALLVTDSAGSLVYPVLKNDVIDDMIVGNHGTLVKLAKDGTMLFEVALPHLPPGPTGKDWWASQAYDGPWVDRTGNIWMVLHRRSVKDVLSTKGVRTVKVVGTTEFLMFDGADGALRVRKTAYQGYEQDLKENPDGTYRITTGAFPVFERYAVGNGLFAGFGTLQTSKEQLTRRGFKRVDQNSWCLAAVDAAANVSTFKYKGRGKEIIENGSDSYKGDGSSNLLEDAWIDRNNAIYLAGEVSSGMVKNGMGNLHWDYLLMKLNTPRKVAWKKLYPDGQPEYMSSFFFHEGEQKVMLVDQVQTGITVFSPDGAESTSPLSFQDALWRFTHHPDPMAQANTEAGVIHAALFGGSYYGAKYSFPPMTFGPAAVPANSDAEGFGAPDRREVAANYPNPFNPATTISIALPSDADVTLRVYNAIGQLVATLAENEPFLEGESEMEFDGTGRPSGLYFYRLTAIDPEGTLPPIRATGKMLLMK